MRVDRIKIEKYLFQPKESVVAVLSPSEIEIKQRYELLITKKMDRPLTPDKELVEDLLHGFSGIVSPVQKSQAYRDLAVVTQLVGKIQIASKNWYRHIIIEGSMEIYQKALHNNDFKGAAAALDKLGKYTRCDKDDDVMDWSDMLPPNWQVSADVSVIEGMTAIDTADLEKERERLRHLFVTGMKKEAEDVECVAVSADGN